MGTEHYQEHRSNLLDARGTCCLRTVDQNLALQASTEMRPTVATPADAKTRWSCLKDEVNQFLDTLEDELPHDKLNDADKFMLRMLKEQSSVLFKHGEGVLDMLHR